jgi:outer membrane lipoprotein SlyB
MKGQAVVVLLLASLMTACLAPEPILRSNKKLQLYGREAAQEEINTCREKVEQAGLTPGVHQSGNAATGAVLGVTLGGAVGASAGVIGGLTGVAIGAAAGAGLGLVVGLVGGTFKPVVPDPPYADAVAKCLKEKGYEVSSWE